MQNKPLKVQYKTTGSLTEYANNARIHTERQVEQIAESIKRFGFTAPILITDEGSILAGHGRLMAARLAGLKKVPTITIAQLDDTQQRAYMLADNKLALNASWNIDLLKTELVGLVDDDFDLSVIGFDADELDDLLADVGDSSAMEDDDTIPGVQSDVVSVTGDIWTLGNHRVLCGDATSTQDIQSIWFDEKPCLVFSDPPYGIGIVDASKKDNTKSVVRVGGIGGDRNAKTQTYKSIKGDDSTDTAAAFYAACLSLGFENFILFGGNHFAGFLPPSRGWIVWDKENSGDFADVELAWTSYNRPEKLYKWLWNGLSRKGDHQTEGATRIHPSQKPVGLFVDILEDVADSVTVFDGFLGSGSTLVACEKTGRVCYGIEYEPAYVDMIVRRWQTFTGKKATTSSGKTIDSST